MLLLKLQNPPLKKLRMGKKIAMKKKNLLILISNYSNIALYIRNIIYFIDIFYEINKTKTSILMIWMFY